MGYGQNFRDDHMAYGRVFLVNQCHLGSGKEI